MYQLANCTVSILRRDPTAKNARGDAGGEYVEISTGNPASIVESSRSTFDRATQTPRTIRVVSGLLGSGTDVLGADRIRDDTNAGILYVAQTVTQPRAFGYLPDIELDLKRVGTGD
jgi:hypothetical protein